MCQLLELLFDGGVVQQQRADGGRGLNGFDFFLNVLEPDEFLLVVVHFWLAADELLENGVRVVEPQPLVLLKARQVP